jgi:hypothetical protein
MALGCSNLNSSAAGRRARVAGTRPGRSAPTTPAQWRQFVFVGGQVDHLAADEGLDLHALQLQPGSNFRGQRRRRSIALRFGNHFARGRVEHVGVERAAHQVVAVAGLTSLEHLAVGRLDEAKSLTRP